jgi:hypothetical protein
MADRIPVLLNGDYENLVGSAVIGGDGLVQLHLKLSTSEQLGKMIEDGRLVGLSLSTVVKAAVPKED